MQQPLQTHLFAFQIEGSGNDRRVGDSFMHRDQPIGGAYDRDDRRLGTKTVAVDQKLNLVRSQIAKAAGGNLLAGQVVDRGDIRDGRGACAGASPTRKKSLWRARHERPR